MRFSMILFIVLFTMQGLTAQNNNKKHQDKIDTLYYDNNWYVINNKLFASYYRYALYPSNNWAPKKVRTFYITGELEGEGNFITLSYSHDKKSKFTGEYTHYHKSGKVSQTCFYKNGLLDGAYKTYDENGNITMECNYSKGELNGEYITYFENGNPSMKCNYKNGILDGNYITYYEAGFIHAYLKMVNGVQDGISTIFSDSGETCTQYLYTHGECANYYLLADKYGNFSLYNKADDSPIYTAPTEEDLHLEYKNGAEWPYYNKNGIIIGVSQYKNESVGSYREIHFFLSNNSMNNVDIDPETIEIRSSKKGKSKIIEPITSDDYYDKIYKNKKKDAKKVMKRKVVVKKDKQKKLNNYLGATLFDETLITIKDFQERMIYKQEFLENKYILADNTPENIEYLQRTTVHPGETVSGYLLINNKKADTLYVDIVINGILYPFLWDLNKNE